MWPDLNERINTHFREWTEVVQGIAESVSTKASALSLVDLSKQLDVLQRRVDDQAVELAAVRR